MSWKELTKNGVTAAAAENALVTDRVDRARAEMRDRVEALGRTVGRSEAALRGDVARMAEAMERSDKALMEAVRAHTGEFEAVRRMVSKVQDAQDTMANVYGEKLMELQNNLAELSSGQADKVVADVRLIGKRIETSEKRAQAEVDATNRRMDAYITRYLPEKISSEADRAALVVGAVLEEKYRKLQWAVAGLATPWVLAVGGAVYWWVTK